MIGPKPQRTPGLTGYPGSEQQLQTIADKVWGAKTDSPLLQRSYGKGWVVCGLSISEVLGKAAVPPDFAFQSKTDNAFLDFIHRRCDDAEVYFVVNRRASALHADCTFRVSGKQPELWDQVTGEQRDLPQFESKDGRTSVPLEFEPYGAMFVVFRKSVQEREDTRQSRGEVNFPGLSQTQELTGPWTIQFDPQWFYPTNGLSGDQARGLMVFDKLEDWTKRSEPAVRNFSGTAVYQQVFRMPAPVAGQRCYLDLGTVKDTARVRLNGKDLGVIWCPPWRVEITGAAKPGENALEIVVVNLWPNRLIGDSKLPAGERRTHTGLQIDIVDTSQPVAALVGWISKDPLPSGLLGPVTIQTAQRTGTR